MSNNLPCPTCGTRWNAPAPQSNQADVPEREEKLAEPIGYTLDVTAEQFATPIDTDAAEPALVAILRATRADLLESCATCGHANERHVCFGAQGWKCSVGPDGVKCSCTGFVPPVDAAPAFDGADMGWRCECGDSHHRELAILRVRLARWEEAEASACPEDIGFVEYIAMLEKRLASLPPIDAETRND